MSAIKEEVLNYTLEEIQKDGSSTRLLSIPHIQALYARELIEECKGMSIDELADGYIESGKNVYKDPFDSEVIYDACYDIRQKQEKGMHLRVNIELQKDLSLPYPLFNRITKYGCRLIDHQYEMKNIMYKYRHMISVVSIWLILNPKPEYRNTIYRTSLKSPEGEETLRIIVLNLSKERSPEKILDLSNRLFMINAKKEDKIQMLKNEGITISKEIREEIGRMNAWELVHYSQGYEQGEKNGYMQGEKIGYMQGEKNGYEQGSKKGREETTVIFLKQMMKSFSCSAERAMELLNISKNEQKIYLDLLSKS